MTEPFDRLSHFGDVESLHALLESTPYTRMLGIGVAEEPIGAGAVERHRGRRPILVLTLQRRHHRQHPSAGDPRRGDRRVPRDHRARDADLGEHSEFLPKTIDISFEYLRSGKPRDTFAQATITKHGRRVANVRVVAWQEDPSRPIAAAHGHFLIKPRERRRGHGAGSGA